MKSTPPPKTTPIIKWGHDTRIMEVDWLWKPFIPFGKVTIVEGDGGDGKTTMVLSIAAMMSRGIQPPALERGHLLPSEKTAPITTFYLTNEDEVADTSLKRFVRADGDIHRFAYSAEMQHHMTLTEEELLSVIGQTDCRLLIIDPFQAFLPEGTNLGSITKMRSVFTMLSNVAKRTGVAIVLVGHLNKNESSKDIHRGFGSADIAAAVRSVLMVEMDKNNRERRWVRAIKSNFDESDHTPVRLLFDENRKLSFAELDESETGVEQEVGSHSAPASFPPHPVTKVDRAMAILKEALASGPVSIADARIILAGEGISEKTAQRARQRIGAVQEYINGVPCWTLSQGVTLSLSS